MILSTDFGSCSLMNLHFRVIYFEVFKQGVQLFSLKLTFNGSDVNTRQPPHTAQHHCIPLNA